MSADMKHYPKCVVQGENKRNLENVFMCTNWL